MRLVRILALAVLAVGASRAQAEYIGSWKIDDYLTFTANTHTAATGAATDADAVPAYRVYEDETGAAITNATMALLDDANTTGFYSERIQLLAATGFEKGKTYTIYISAAVATITGTCHRTFQIEAEVDAATMSDTAWTVDITGDLSGSVGSVAGTVDGNVTGSAGDLLKISGSAAAANNAEIVFDTDFATNYDTTADTWTIDLDNVDGTLSDAEIATIDVNVASVDADAIEAGDLKTGAIDADAVADGAIDAGAIAAAAIDNATFASDVGSTAYASNPIALAVRKVLDELNLDHWMKVAVADNDDMTTEVVDGTVLSNLMTVDADTSDYAGATDSFEGLSILIAGGGTIEWAYTLTSDVDGSPIAQALVEVYTGSDKTGFVTKDYTDNSGIVTFYLDAGTYYFWRTKSGFSGTNPDTEVVSE